MSSEIKTNFTGPRRDYEAWALTQRPDSATLEYIRSVPTAFVSDCLKRLEIRNHALRDVRLAYDMPGKQVSIAGAAITMQWAPHSEVRPYFESPYLHTQVVEQARAGDVIVIAGMGAPYGFWGEHASNQAINQGVQGIVIDGYTRDIKPIRKSGLCVFSTGVTFESYVRRFDPVGFNTTVSVAGAMVRPGDVMMGDDDGVLVIPQEIVGKVAEVAADIERLEVDLGEAVKAGVPWSDIYRDIHHRKYYQTKPLPKF
ncbi:MAG: RraA family protein [Lautropia sp.]